MQWLHMALAWSSYTDARWMCRLEQMNITNRLFQLLFAAADKNICSHISNDSWKCAFWKPLGLVFSPHACFEWQERHPAQGDLGFFTLKINSSTCASLCYMLWKEEREATPEPSWKLERGQHFARRSCRFPCELSAHKVNGAKVLLSMFCLISCTTKHIEASFIVKKIYYSIGSCSLRLEI